MSLPLGGLSEGSPSVQSKDPEVERPFRAGEIISPHSTVISTVRPHPRPFFQRQREKTSQNTNRACNWNMRGGSMLANAGIALVAVPTPTNWPNVLSGVAVSP
jgi:hypothetical protein